MNADEPIRPDRPDPLVPESTGSGTSGIDADWGADGHLGWRLSALLDGELPVAEELRAREHLSTCDFCQDEFTEVMSARAFVRGLGDVEPPQGYVDRILTRIHRRSQVRIGLVSLVSFAAIWIVVLLIAAGVVLPAGTPDVEALGQQHAGLIANGPGDFGDAAAIVDPTSLDAPYVLPAALASSFERTGAWDLDDQGVVGLYRTDTAAVSVFEQTGSLDWDDLPAGGEVRQIGGERAWTITLDPAQGAARHVVVVPEYPAVYTVVSTSSLDDALTVAADLPEPQHYSWSDRVQSNLDRWF